MLCDNSVSQLKLLITINQLISTIIIIIIIIIPQVVKIPRVKNKKN